MSLTERLSEGVKDAFGPQTFLASAVQGAIQQATNRPSEWGQGARGYGLRTGDAYAQRLLGAMFQDGFALGLHQDNRYFNSGKHGVGRRLLYALTSPVLARRDNGTRTLSLSVIGGIGASSAISQLWQPRSTASWPNLPISFAYTIGFRAGVDVVREFSPRIVGVFIR